MDRDKRWERVNFAYDAWLKGREKATDALAAIEHSYAAGITDEFIKPTVIIDEASAAACCYPGWRCGHLF